MPPRRRTSRHGSSSTARSGRSPSTTCRWSSPTTRPSTTSPERRSWAPRSTPRSSGGWRTSRSAENARGRRRGPPSATSPVAERGLGSPDHGPGAGGQLEWAFTHAQPPAIRILERRALLAGQGGGEGAGRPDSGRQRTPQVVEVVVAGPNDQRGRPDVLQADLLPQPLQLAPAAPAHHQALVGRGGPLRLHLSCRVP